MDNGEGDDLAVFAGAFGDYRVAREAGALTVVGPDGSVVLRGVEILRFDDRSVPVRDLAAAAPR